MSKIQRIKPIEAYALLQSADDAILIDVRSTVEHQFVGRPLNAFLVPWIDMPEWEINDDFVEQVEACLNKDEFACNINRPILLLCRSGVRSVEASIELIESGYTNVYSIDEGFEGDKDENSHRGLLGGWRYHKLPWEQC